MVGEPTTFTAEWFTAFGDVADATPLIAEARALKTEQEIDRMRLANDIAAGSDGPLQARHRGGHDRGGDRRGMGGLRPRRRHGWEGRVDLRWASRSSGRGPGS